MSDVKPFKKCSRLREHLMHLYPGVKVEVLYNDHAADSGSGSYKGWRLNFKSGDLEVLAKNSLGPGGELLFARHGATEFPGVTWDLHDWQEDGRTLYTLGFHIEEQSSGQLRGVGLTKRTQTQVMRLLNPFIRGTWKPRGEVANG